MELVLQRKLRIVLVVIACVLMGGALCPAGAADVTVCTENLFNYGIPEDVQRLRYPERTLQQVRGRILRQEKALLSRMAACDIVAVQEVVGDEQQRALSALDRLGRLLSQSTGRRYSALVADSSDVIRNGFLFRSDGDLSEAQFDGAHTSDPLPRIPRFGEVHWKRGPAELVVELRQEELRQEAGSPPGSEAPAGGVPPASLLPPGDCTGGGAPPPLHSPRAGAPPHHPPRSRPRSARQGKLSFQPP